MFAKLVLICVIWTTIGCQTGPAFEPESGVSLIDHLAWELVSDRDDPFWDVVSEPVVCPEAAYGVEGSEDASFYEVETADCNYHTVSQPSLVAIEPGDSVKATLWHLPLAALEPAQAKLFVAIGAETVLDENIEIPASEEVYAPEIIADFSAPAGTPIVFHVHNHGVNSWRFHRFTVTR